MRPMQLVTGLAGLAVSLNAAAMNPTGNPQPYDQVIPVADENASDLPPIGVGAVKVTLGGFVKLDTLFSIFSDGRVPSTDQGRDYFRPLSIPVASSATEDPRSTLDFHAKDSRFFFKIDTEVSGHALGGILEADYRSVAGGATEVVTNAFAPRLRRAAVTFDEWTLGQEWTTFRNADAHPENMDDIGGPVEALNIVRQPLIRYDGGAFKASLENSETNLLPLGGGTTFVTGDSKMPDVSARYDLKSDWGNYGIAVVGRQLAAEAGSGADGREFAYGVNLSGNAPSFAGARVRFGLNYGDGIGRYVGLGTVPDAVVGPTGELETIAAAAGYVSYQQPWAARWRSNLTLGTLQIDNDAALTGASATKSVDTGHVNLIYTPADKLLFGLEYAHAIRKVENGDEGTLDRVQFSAKYSF